jgi:hypothetical protein
VFLAISLVPESLVFNEAALAPRVANPEPWVAGTKLIDRLLDAASPAGFRLWWRPASNISSIGFRATNKGFAWETGPRGGCADYSKRTLVVGTSKIKSSVPLTDGFTSKTRGTTTCRPTGNSAGQMYAESGFESPE